MVVVDFYQKIFTTNVKSTFGVYMCVCVKWGRGEVWVRGRGREGGGEGVIEGRTEDFRLFLFSFKA